MNASDIIAKVQFNIDRDDNTTAITLAALNNRQNQICNIENFYFMEFTATSPTVVAQQSYSLPGGYKDELQLWLQKGDNKTPLIKWVGSEAEKAFSLASTQGQPTNYWVWEGAYFLYPIPDIVYTMHQKAYSYLDPLTNTAAELNDLCKYWADLLIYGGTAEVYHMFQQPDKAVEWEAKFQNELMKLTKRETKRRYSNYTPRLRLRIR